MRRAERESKRAARDQLEQAFQEGITLIADLGRKTNTLMQAVLVAGGLYEHHRQWRRGRGNQRKSTR
ncbi:MAG: hypothetical protein ACLQNE_20170 [Thermoguttaceae bacterium]